MNVLSDLSVFGSENIRGANILVKLCGKIELIFTVLFISCSKLRAKLKENFTYASDGIHCSIPSSNSRFLFALSKQFPFSSSFRLLRVSLALAFIPRSSCETPCVLCMLM